jgi:predicted Rossmann fold nucleotide-binding protein DprA/Smf involved in DNA uptake
MNKTETTQLKEQSITTIGNTGLLDSSKTALFCSRKCPADKIMNACDKFKEWAAEGRTIISGFHSPVEKECLRIFLRAAGNIIVCPARGIENMRIPTDWKQPISNGQLLIISPFTDNIHQPTAATAEKRNNLIVSLAEKITVIHAESGSKLENIVPRK